MTIFIVLFTVLSGSVAWYTFEKNSIAALELSDYIISQVSSAAIKKMVNYQSPLQEATATTATLAAKRTTGEPTNALNHYLLDVLKVCPQFYGIYAGNNDGSFIQAINLPRAIKSFGPPNSPIPKQTRWVYRVLERSTQTITDEWKYVNAQNESLANEIAPKVTYDPRTRPWYLGTQKLNRPYWTDLYVFTSLGKLGITASTIERVQKLTLHICGLKRPVNSKHYARLLNTSPEDFPPIMCA
jgi:hypothetical protein